MPYGKNHPLWGQNHYQQGWAPLVRPAYRPPMHFNTQLSFLATLELLDVSPLTNDPMLHSSYLPLVLSKILIDSPKLVGKEKEDP